MRLTKELAAHIMVDHGIDILSKNDSKLMKAFSWLFVLIGGRKAFMNNYVTTIGRKIYVPAALYGQVLSTRHGLKILQHEFIHVGQWESHGVLFWLSYLLLPVPVLFAWFRWRWEREAYFAVELRDWGHDIDSIVDSLWKGYFFPWPKPWMRRWFEKELARGSI